MQGRRELGDIGGGGGVYWVLDQQFVDLILTNQCHFKATFSGEGSGGGTKPYKQGKCETSRFPRMPEIGKRFYDFN